MAQLPSGAVPAFLGLILLVAVLIEPYVVQRRVLARLWARLHRPAAAAILRGRHRHLAAGDQGHEGPVARRRLKRLAGLLAIGATRPPSCW